MFPGRIGALRNLYKDNSKDRLGSTPKKRPWTKEEVELQRVKIEKLDQIEDFDVYENSKTKLRFRKYPWPFWFIGFAFLAGAIYILHLSLIGKIKFKKSIQEFLILSFMAVMAAVFLYTGKIKSTVFDKKNNQLMIRKRNICCHRRSITLYKLADIVDARAVWRGMKVDAVNTVHYSILLEFDNSNKDT
jgi:hypothetical protein